MQADHARSAPPQPEPIEQPAYAAAAPAHRAALVVVAAGGNAQIVGRDGRDALRRFWRQACRAGDAERIRQKPFVQRGIGQDLRQEPLDIGLHRRCRSS